MSGSRGPRRGLDARAEKAFLWEPGAAAALPELRPAGLPSQFPLLPLLSSLSHETASRERDISPTQSNKSHFNLKGKTEFPSQSVKTSPYLFMFPQALFFNLDQQASDFKSQKSVRPTLRGLWWSAGLWEL